jgi:Holliday junction resolvase RusA-like endonuclease
VADKTGKAVSFGYLSHQPMGDSSGQPERIPPGAVIVKFTVHGKAIPWKPSRVTTNGTYKPKAVRDWQAAVRLTTMAAMGARPVYSGPVRITVDIRHTSGIVGDWDNLSKAIIDATQGIAIANDRQILAASVTKLRDDHDHVTVTYYALDWPDSPQIKRKRRVTAS